jgi:hypothetical protein
MHKSWWAALVALSCVPVVGCGSSGSSHSNFSHSNHDSGTNIDGGSEGGIQVDGGNKDGSSGCPSTCQALGANCGPVTDTKCGGIVQCGSCPSGQACGAGGPNVCGTGTSSDAGKCTPKTCADLGANCGAVSDGCGGLLQCGTCATGQQCGLGGPNVCGTTVPEGGTCTPQTCADQGLSCGPAGDGCGGTLDCGSCTAPDTCGGGGTPGQCGSPPCVPLTCAGQSVSCGPAGDGCGNQLNCGSCTSPKTCGGGNTPGQCGCTGVCAQIPSCPTGQTTTLTGSVYDPAGNNPLYDVLVYVPNDPSAITSFPVGPTCDVCGATAQGDPLVTTQTAVDGTFTLSGVPVGSSIPLVIQLGRWRRVFTVSIPNSCTTNTVTGAGITNGKLTMPKNKSQGNIPLTAIVTGDADALECVFLKMGIDQAEFTDPGAATPGRIQFYQGDGHHNTDHGGGARIDANTPSETQLFQNNGSTMDTYDMVILSCQGRAYTTSQDASLANYPELVNYANMGGRIFTSHYSYTYLTQGGNNNAFYGTANWNLSHDAFDSATAVIDTNTADNPKGPDFAAWMGVVNALATTTPPTFTVEEPRWDVDSVISPSQQWMTWTNEQGGNNSSQNQTHTLHYTFNAPVGAQNDAQCGRVLFSDFHVVTTGNNGTYNDTFPSECGNGPMTPQEKALEFMIFDLGSCVQPYQPLCTPETCAQQNIQCGPAGDGCGNLIQCGTCPSGQTCGGGGVPGQCGSTTCTPETCGQQNIACGPAGDGCGNLIQCGTCPAGQTCGGGGVPGQCGAPDGGSCKPETCAQQNIQCGPAGDGCGGTLQCGTCPSGQTCGGGGKPGQCGSPTCTPETCAQQNIACGPAGDGCGGTLDCGNCPAGQICGLNQPGQCGSVH